MSAGLVLIQFFIPQLAVLGRNLPFSCMLWVIGVSRTNTQMWQWRYRVRAAAGACWLSPNAVLVG